MKKELSELVKDALELNVEFIIFNGFYIYNVEEIQKHNTVTETLYNIAFNSTHEEIEECDCFNGVCFDNDNKPLAEWCINGKEEYFEF